MVKVDPKDIKTEKCKVCGEPLPPDTVCPYLVIARKENEIARTVREAEAVDRLLTSASHTPSFLRPPRAVSSTS